MDSKPPNKEKLFGYLFVWLNVNKFLGLFKIESINTLYYDGLFSSYSDARQGIV